MYSQKPLGCDYTTIILDEESIPCKLFKIGGTNHQGKTDLINKFRVFVIRRQIPLPYAIPLLWNITLAINNSNHNFEYNNEDHSFHCNIYSLSEDGKVVFDVILSPHNQILYLRLKSV